VDAGDAVGASGDTGTLDGRSRLHFEVLRGSEPEDPMVWLTR
jgi:septal ring factor EnvC (AmiA/AmiB activator)